MPRYRVVGTVVGTKYLGEFTADTAEQAVEMALESGQAFVDLCHQCSDQCDNAEISRADAEEETD
jgi:hypothetical protein